MARWTGWLVVMLFLSVGLAMPSASGAQLSGLAQVELVESDEPLQAAIYPGACVSPGEPVRTALAPLQKPPGGDRAGVAGGLADRDRDTTGGVASRFLYRGGCGWR